MMIWEKVKQNRVIEVCIVYFQCKALKRVAGASGFLPFKIKEPNNSERNLQPTLYHVIAWQLRRRCCYAKENS